MSPEDLEIFKEQLETELEKVDARLGTGLPKGENANCSHQADVASTAQERMLEIPLRNLYRDRRAQIIVALSRVGNGTFGICARCKKEIERERLKAIPFTPVCALCAQATA